MKFFIDTASLSEIKEAQDLGILDGVTTNPSLMAKEGIGGEENVRKHYKAICEIVDGDVSAEVISTDYEGMSRIFRLRVAPKDSAPMRMAHQLVVRRQPLISMSSLGQSG